MTYDEVVAIALGYPGVVQSTSYGTPAIKLGTKFILREREPGVIALQRPTIDERNMLLEMAPEIFYITDHYRDYPYALVRLAAIAPDHFRALFETIWRDKATQKQIRAYQTR